MTEMSAHPAPEELAAYAAGDLEDSGAVRAHLAGCSSCGGSVAGIQRATTALAGLPPLPMPVDVITALERALAEEATSASAVPDGATSLAAVRRRSGRLAPLAAAAAVIGLAAALGGGVLRDRGSDDAGTLAGASADQDTTTSKAAPIILRSGTDYTPDVLDLQVRDQLGAVQPESLSAPAPAAGVAADSRSGGSAEPPTTLEMATAAAPTLTDDELQSCVDELSGTPGSAPLLVDFATYAGEPAVVVVLPFRENKVDVFIVRPECRVGNDALIFFKRIAAES